jgi:hypothetical protein
MPTLDLPTSRLVTAGWLIAAVPGFTGAMVGVTLPRKPEKWTATGFVQVGPVVGGTPHDLLPVAKPVVSVHVYGVNGTQANPPDGPWSWSGRPPWARTAQLCERIRAAILTGTYDGGRTRQVAMPAVGYAHAYVHAVSMLTEPREVLGDAGSYAHHMFDLQLVWTPEAV